MRAYTVVLSWIFSPLLLLQKCTLLHCTTVLTALYFTLLNFT